MLTTQSVAGRLVRTLIYSPTFLQLYCRCSQLHCARLTGRDKYFRAFFQKCTRFFTWQLYNSYKCTQVLCWYNRIVTSVECSICVCDFLVVTKASIKHQTKCVLLVSSQHLMSLMLMIDVRIITNGIWFDSRKHVSNSLWMYTINGLTGMDWWVQVIKATWGQSKE